MGVFWPWDVNQEAGTWGLGLSLGSSTDVWWPLCFGTVFLYEAKRVKPNQLIQKQTFMDFGYAPGSVLEGHDIK